jgi:hypothetical protein
MYSKTRCHFFSRCISSMTLQEGTSITIG